MKIHPGRLTWNIYNSLEVWFRSFSFLNGWFVGSMLIFQGVSKRCAFLWNEHLDSVSLEVLLRFVHWKMDFLWADRVDTTAGRSLVVSTPLYFIPDGLAKCTRREDSLLICICYKNMYQLAFLLQQVNAYMAMAQNYCARKWTGQYQIRPMLAHVAFLVEPFARHMSPLEVLQCNHTYHSECFEGVLSSEQLELQELRRKVGRVELGGASNPLKNLTFTDPLVVKVSNLNLTCVFFFLKWHYIIMSCPIQV